MVQDPEVEWLVPKDFSEQKCHFSKGKKREKKKTKFETQREV